MWFGRFKDMICGRLTICRSYLMFPHKTMYDQESKGSVKCNSWSREHCLIKGNLEVAWLKY